MTSEELWHKVHVNASFATIPFLLISILLIFLNILWAKIVVGLLLLLILPMIWNIVVKLTKKNKSLELRKQEQQELESQIKKIILELIKHLISTTNAINWCSKLSIIS